MATELVTVECPIIPSSWDYEESTNKVRQLIYKWGKTPNYFPY